MPREQFQGVLVPALTPFKSDLTPDEGAFVEHCRWLLEQGADGLAVFGTTSEANSLGVDERMRLLDALMENGIPASALMPGTGTCALTDTLRLTAHAVEHGCGGVLMLPPFYYKAIDDEGLFASYSEVIQRIGDAALRIYLYHIPPVAQVSISLELIGRLLLAYPDVVVGLKDSSGDWSHTEAVLREYPALATFCGSEVFLLQTLRHGGAGSITATANVNPSGIRLLYQRWQEAEADTLQAGISSVRRAFETAPMIPGLKSIVAALRAHAEWRNVRPPLCPLSDAASNVLERRLKALQFSMGERKSESAV